MIYKKYGEAFRIIRKQHHFTLKDFEKIGISKSTLSYFENGKSLISFDKLDMALHEMHTTFRAYLLLLNHGEEDYWLSQFKAIENAYFGNQQHILNEIYQNNIEYETEESRMIALSAKACYSNLSDEELSHIEKTLEGYSVWYSYELSILVNTLDQINPTLLYHIMDQIIEQKYYYLREVADYRSLLIRLIIRASLLSIRNKDRKYSLKLIKELKGLTSSFDIFTRTSSLFLHGCWIYQFEDQTRGRKLVSRSLKILSDIDALELRAVFLSNFNRIAL